MATFSYNYLLVFAVLLSGTFLSSAAALCDKQGEAVLDTNGKHVRIGHNYMIKYTASNSQNGMLGLVQNKQSQCEKYVGSTSRRQAELVHFTSGTDMSEDNTMREGGRYAFNFIAQWNHPCKLPGRWTTGKENSNADFTPIVAAQDPNSNDIRRRWFEVRRAEEEKEGSYKLSVCTCSQPKQCPCAEVGINNLNGQIVLGEGGDSVTMRFEKEQQQLARKIAMQ
ncbi:Kunitz family serine protease inhibitor [Arthrobacter sp. E3]|uniref:Kunitz family serine protease inhibitor n=2 Tax=Bacillati TaxID=1783272 RepID=UPI001A93B5D9|nr:Kunitz family serine protease inhibitor [Arthrobacter sp. E3]